jgi:uncharacterized protein YegL
MAVLFKPGTFVQAYKIVELAGDGSQSNVYLADRENSYYWLIQIEAPDWDPQVRSMQMDSFDANGSKWVALPISGTSIVNLASWVDKLELSYIGWRWAKLAEEIGYVHNKDVVLQRSQPLALDRLIFNNFGELIVTQADRVRNDDYTFPAPESPSLLSAASDVYSLGASLKALAGENLPRNIETVLQRATNPDPAKRYPNGKAFGEALAQALPNPKREAAPRPPRRTNRLVLVAAVLVGLCLVVSLGIFALLQLTPELLPLPTEVAVQPLPPRVTILKWKIEGACDGRAEVRVEDGDHIVTPDDGVQFFAVTPQATVTEINVAPGTNPGESILTFPLGEFCKVGGALSIGARRDTREGKSTVYYYPGDGDPESVALYKKGGSQVLIGNNGTRLRVYFGLSNQFGDPAGLKGAVSVNVFQDGAAVKEFKLQGVNGRDNPLVSALVLDTSKSMTGEPLAKAQQAASNYIDKLEDEDLVCVYRFSTQVAQAHVCSRNHKGAITDVNELTAGGNTALYDVLARVSAIHTDRADRQAIILLSDGADNSSTTTREQAIQQVAATNIPVYVVALGGQELAPPVLREIAEKTGGVYLEAPTPDDLIELYDTLRASFDLQYQIDFDSLFPERKSGTLEIVVSDGTDELKIQRDYVVGQ